MYTPYKCYRCMQEVLLKGTQEPRCSHSVLIRIGGGMIGPQHFPVQHPAQPAVPRRPAPGHNPFFPEGIPLSNLYARPPTPTVVLQPGSQPNLQGKEILHSDKSENFIKALVNEVVEKAIDKGSKEEDLPVLHEKDLTKVLNTK